MTPDPTSHIMTSAAENMNAIRIHEVGGPEGMVYERAPRPRLASGDALVEVYAAALTPAELTWKETWADHSGKSRLPIIPSHEVSGVIAALGEDVADLEPGEAVYGLTDFSRDGAAAEFVAVRAADLASKPRSIGHLRAAAMPLSALTAWQALFDHGALTAGRRVLIHGAAGGVGSFAVQLARAKGAEVIAVASGRHRDFLQGLGANTVVDYETARFEDVARGVDLVLDTVGGETLRRSWAVLKPGGTLVSVAEPPPEQDAVRVGARGIFFIVKPNRAQLSELARLTDAGKLRTFVSEVFALDRAREAYETLLRGHLRGKIVVRVKDRAE
jgi:NADPH:quinone reductase-like Zn-dependent oxidoreductase